MHARALFPWWIDAPVICSTWHIKCKLSYHKSCNFCVRHEAVCSSLKCLKQGGATCCASLQPSHPLILHACVLQNWSEVRNRNASRSYCAVVIMFLQHLFRMHGKENQVCGQVTTALIFETGSLEIKPTTTLGQTRVLIIVHDSSSASFSAEISISLPRKLCIFIIYKGIWSTFPKKTKKMENGALDSIHRIVILATSATWLHTMLQTASGAGGGGIWEAGRKAHTEGCAKRWLPAQELQAAPCGCGGGYQSWEAASWSRADSLYGARGKHALYLLMLFLPILVYFTTTNPVKTNLLYNERFWKPLVLLACDNSRCTERAYHWPSV